MTLNQRTKFLRNELNMTQIDFGNKIGISQGHLTQIEQGKKGVTEKTIKVICLTFNVNETWLRTGEGDMFIQSKTFSLDEYAKKNNLTPLELDIIRGYIELDKDTRQKVLNHFKTIFNKHPEESMPAGKTKQQKLEEYSQELDAEEKGRRLSVLRQLEEGAG